MPDKCVRWLKLALEDMNRLLVWLEKKSDKATARMVAQRIWDAANGLRSLSSRGRPGRVPDTRELQVANTSHFLVYRVKGNTVEILRVMHYRRKYPD